MTAKPGRLIGMTRRRSPYGSSHPLEELTLTLAQGGERRLAFKRLGTLPERGPTAGGRSRPAPLFLVDPLREGAVYESVLPHAPAGAPALFGSTAGPGAERWLFIEWVSGGRELYQVGELAIWEHVARWLGSFHAALAPDVERHAREGRLLAYDGDYYRGWLERARWFARARGHASRAVRFLDSLARRHDPVVEALLELPRTVVHGDFNAANVLVVGAGEGDGDGRPSRVRVAPVDWELAAEGPGLVDLATLISGSWSDAERERLTAAYAGAPESGNGNGAGVGVPAFSPRQLACARLHVALRWLGWAPAGWTPPRAHRHDWLADAIALAGELEL